jgi:hypothetical protein
MRRRLMTRSGVAAALVLVAFAAAGCGGTRLLHQTQTVTVSAPAPSPGLATKNTTRISGADPIADAAGVALAVFPSAAAGTHPAAVTLAPTDDWEAALASSVLMAAPLHAPVLLSGAASLPSATATALTTLAPTGSGAAGGAQLIRVGAVPATGSGPTAALQSEAIGGKDPFTLAAAIDQFQSAAAGKPSSDVVVASTADPGYAMPAAGWAAESGDPILFVGQDTLPAATREALQSHGHPRIYVLGPASVVSAGVVRKLRALGTVKRISAPSPVASSVAFAAYRDPPCVTGQACAHVPGSFGWAMRSPGHGYTLLNQSRPLDAAASAALSGSGDYGPQLLVDDPTNLPKTVLNFFLDYATPGYTQAGPTVAVYNHGWMIGDESAISAGVQAEVDHLLEVVPVSR